MSSELLRELHDSGALPVARLADLLNLSKSAAYQYHALTELRYSQLRTVIRQSRSREVLDRFAADLFGGLGAALIFAADDAEADLDCDQAVQKTVEAIELLARLLKKMHAAVADRQITDRERDELEQFARRVVELVLQSMRAIDHENDQRHKRRKCRPLAISGSEVARG